MKKTLSLILALLLCLSLCACSDNNTQNNESTEATNDTTGTTNTAETVNTATITTNEGKTVEVSVQDLFNEYDANEARFNKLYKDAVIEFIGTVKYIKVDTGVYDGKNVISGQSKIVFEEGWCLIIGNGNTTYDLADYYPGQKLEVSTGIVSAAFDTEFLQAVADNNRVVWLVGNEKVMYDIINSHTTTIAEVE